MAMPSGFVPTKYSRLKKRPAADFESVTFTSRKPKDVKKRTNVDKNDTTEEPGKSMDMKKLRYEVIKFGTSGMDPTKKEASSIALAVALGAKPPKKKYQNYKEILNAKKSEKEKVNQDPLNRSKNRHLYVVGNKVIPAKPKTTDGPKNFLESYGKAGRSKLGKGFKKKRDGN